MTNKKVMIAAGAAFLAGIVATYFFLQSRQQPALVSSPLPLPELKPVVRQVIETPPGQVLPDLADSDKLMLDALAGLAGNGALLKLLNVERIIRNIVVTIDNLPNEHAPLKAMPLKPVQGVFIVEGATDHKVISPKNAARYEAYIKALEAMDAQKLVEVYVRLYPLFQQAYEELGYPKKYFNDRLLEVLDHLLAAPEPDKPIKLAQPHVLYTFADTGLQACSAGQKILMRMGRANEAKIKVKLQEIKQQVLLHMQARKIAPEQGKTSLQ